jgi:hypothetical protein
MSTLITGRVQTIPDRPDTTPDGNLTDGDWFAEELELAPRPSPAPPVAPAPAPTLTPPVSAAPPSGRDRILAGLLRMADSYRAAGSLRQAMEMYFQIARDHDETPEVEASVERLLDVARGYENSGELRQARSIYEQLL